MAKLPGWVWMIAGALVLGYSLFIEARSGKNLIVFIWLGSAFIVFGLGREFFTRIRKRPEKERPEPPKQQPERPHVPAAHTQTHQHVKPVQHPSHPHEPAHKACPRCHSTNFYRAKFCHTCGYQFH